MHAQIVLFDGFDPLDVIAPYEVLYADGTAYGTGEEVPLTDLALDGDQLILAATEHRP